LNEGFNLLNLCPHDPMERLVFARIAPVPFEPDSPRKSLRLQLTRRGQIPIVEPAAPLPHYLPPRFRALALFERRPHECMERLVILAFENLHRSRLHGGEWESDTTLRSAVI
jgi:hypothetical protein